MRGLSVLVALAICGPAWGAPKIRTLFVGINHYDYTTLPGADPRFHDLHGAAADVVLVKAALTKAYALTLDTPTPGVCEKPGADSVTLLEGCATRANIMAALTRMSAASAKDDVILFYFAGHGSQARDVSGEKASGQTSTILQSDARKNMNDPDSADILSTELRPIINEASNRGVNVVSIFDSCNSGTATRALGPDVSGRSAPRLPDKAAQRPAVIDRTGPGPGYIVHLAAAADGVIANEKPMEDGQTHGVFSWAIASALTKAADQGRPTVSYADVFYEASRTVTTLGFAGQQPYSEGDLNASFLGRGAIATHVAQVTRSADGALGLDKGSMSGVTAGSEYGLFATSAEAAGDRPATTTATVAEPVTPFTAALSVSGPAPATLLWARETAHRFAVNALKVQVVGEGPARQAVLDILASPALNLVRVVDRDPQFVIQAHANAVSFLSADGTPVPGDALDPRAPHFADAVGVAVRKVASYTAILGLRDGATGRQPTITINADGADPCKPHPPATPAVRIALGLAPAIALTNTAAEPRYLYLLDFESDYTIYTLYPPQHGTNDAYPPGKTTIQESLFTAGSEGMSHLMLLSTRLPVDVGAFQQNGLGAPPPTRALPGNPSPLERLVAAANAGKRGGEGPPVVDWGASLTTLVVGAKAAAHPTPEVQCIAPRT